MKAVVGVMLRRVVRRNVRRNVRITRRVEGNVAVGDILSCNCAINSK